MKRMNMQRTLDFPETSTTSLLLPGPIGVLEVITDLPESSEARAGVAVICHPHPLHGGTMHNKVVTTVERSLRELGLATVRFNFRGVGASAGAFDDGAGETDDLLAVVEWLGKTRPGDSLWLAGFSFGSYVAARAAAQLSSVRELISIAPPVSRWDFSALSAPGCPWLMIQGENDEVVDPEAVYAWVVAQSEPPTLIRIPETGHFFHGRLMELRSAIKNALSSQLPALLTKL